MFHHLLTEYTPLYLAQLALTIWMLIDASRRGVESYWFWLILAFQPLGAWAYFFLHKVKDFSPRSGSGANWLSNLFTRKTSLAELRYRAEQSPTVASHLALAHRLLEDGEPDEAEPHLRAVLAREPDLGTALFALARCERARGRHAEAVPPLVKLTTQRPEWQDYQGMHVLIDTYQTVGNLADAIAQARRLGQLAPSLEHKCLLARLLGAAGKADEARQILERGLEEYRFSRTPSRGDRRWVGKTRQLLKELQ